MRFKTILSSLLLIQIGVFASPSIDHNENKIHTLSARHQFEDNLMRKLTTKCSQRDMTSCSMLKWLSYMNRLFKKSTIALGESLEITQNREIDVIDEPEDDLLMSRAAATSEADTLGYLITDKLFNFIRSRTLRYKLFNEADLVVSNEVNGNLNVGLSINPKSAVETGRGKMKNLTPIIAAVGAKIGVFLALGFKALVLLVGKALIVSKIALVLSILIALKKFLSKKHVTYEVVGHPHHTADIHHHHPPTVVGGTSNVGAPIHDSYSSGWGRAIDGFIEGIGDYLPNMASTDSHDKIYAGQKP